MKKNRQFKTLDVTIPHGRYVPNDNVAEIISEIYYYTTTDIVYKEELELGFEYVDENIKNGKIVDKINIGTNFIIFEFNNLPTDFSRINYLQLIHAFRIVLDIVINEKIKFDKIQVNFGNNFVKVFGFDSNEKVFYVEVKFPNININ